LNLQFAGAKIDQKAVLDPASAKIAQQLSDVFVSQTFTGFQFNNQLAAKMPVSQMPV